jgi:hypothetical protein
MNKKKLVIFLFSCFAVVLIAVPVMLIRQQENILTTGQEFKFKTQPMDPFDAFRGRYVALSFERTPLDMPANVKFNSGQTVYVQIENKPDGFARFSRIFAAAPANVAYLKCRVSWLDNKGKVYFDVPFSEYYLQESKAPKAEKLYREHTARNVQDGYIVLSVKNGESVIKGLYLGGKPIEELLKK